ncbi:MAG: IS1595 family transposase [Solirubrobacteraceae bacterium]|nr:IS1595 family transposase [Solirubrobacteraceae bacterium]
MASSETSPRAGVDYPRAWHELNAWFPDDEACLAYLERLRWGDGFVCRFCGTVGGDWWPLRRGLRRCAACRHETSVTAGTIFHGSRLPLNSWFAAVWYVVNQKQGVSALGLQSVLGFGSYQTAWAWLHKLRRAMVLPGREMLTGAVEVDESYIGGTRPGKHGRGADGKAIIVIAVEDRGKSAGRVRMARIPDVSADTLTDFVLDHVTRGAEVHTDAWPGYHHIGRHRFSHVVTHVGVSGDPAHVALPHVHRVASLLKRWLLGTHQGAVTHEQLDYYLDEFTFRFNRRRSRHRGLLFYRLLEGALAAQPAPYKTLISPRALPAGDSPANPG